MLEMKSVIVGILRKYKLIAVDKPEDIILEQEIILRPKDGIKMKIVPRV